MEVITKTNRVREDPPRTHTSNDRHAPVPEFVQDDEAERVADGLALLHALSVVSVGNAQRIVVVVGSCTQTIKQVGEAAHGCEFSCQPPRQGAVRTLFVVAHGVVNVAAQAASKDEDLQRHLVVVGKDLVHLRTRTQTDELR